MLIKVKVYRPDSVVITDAGISVPKRRFGIQVKERFLGFGIGKEKLPLAVGSDIKLSKKDGQSTVASQPLSRVTSVASQCAISLAPPTWSYVCYDDSRMMVGRRIRFTKLRNARTMPNEGVVPCQAT
jgi:hypothetical protein